MEHANADCLQTSKRVRKIEHGCSRRSKQTKQHEDTIASGCACYQVATSDFVHHIHAGHYVSAGRQAHCCKRITNKTQMQTSIHACHTSTYKFCEIRMFADHAMLCTEGATGSPFFYAQRTHALGVRAYTPTRTDACAHTRVVKQGVRAHTPARTDACAHTRVRAHAHVRIEAYAHTQLLCEPCCKLANNMKTHWHTRIYT